jgi:hypothetical protein
MSTILCKACGVRHSTWSRAWKRHRKAHEALDSSRRDRITRLGIYNAERERGIVHTTAYDNYMRAEQEWFDGSDR